MGNDLSERAALVTGGGRGIGRAIALGLAEAGANVAVNYRSNEGAAKETCGRIEKMGRRAVSVRADVSSGPEVARMIKAVHEALGSIDILVNNAGIVDHSPFEEIREEDWDRVIRVNLKSVFLATKEALPGMRSRGWGRIINLSSVAAQIGGIVGPHYAASKAGILGLTRFYASRLAKEGITVNAISPALIDTEMIADNPQASPERIPVGRFGRTAEVAEVAVMLARNGFITGQNFNVDGGLYMH